MDVLTQQRKECCYRVISIANVNLGLHNNIVADMCRQWVMTRIVTAIENQIFAYFIGCAVKLLWRKKKRSIQTANELVMYAGWYDIPTLCAYAIILFSAVLSRAKVASTPYSHEQSRRIGGIIPWESTMRESFVCALCICLQLLFQSRLYCLAFKVLVNIRDEQLRLKWGES